MGRITTSNTRIRKSRNGRTEGVVIIHTSYTRIRQETTQKVTQKTKQAETSRNKQKQGQPEHDETKKTQVAAPGAKYY
jgi:hypothetical protein